MSFSMTAAERESFLAAVHVGVLAVAREGRPPLTVPVWYAYTPGGEVHIVTGRTSRKVVLIERAGRFSLCAQDEAPPYRYVTVEGPVTAIEPADRERDTRPMRRRYLGIAADNQPAAESAESATETNDVVIRMRPERWLSADYGKASG